MGVKSLTSFINLHPNLLTDFKLHNTRVVIDGHGLRYYLYSMDLDRQHGGEYKQYEDKCRDFFVDFKMCNVVPFVIFDGASDMDDKKLQTYKERCQERIRSAANISMSVGSHDNVFPLLLDRVILKVLNDLGIPYAFCNFEADNEIVGLANAWCCPVLGKDSDYFILDIIGGYMPFDHFRRKQRFTLKADSDSQGAASATKYITGKMYNLAKFCRVFNIQKDYMPLFATLAGNDYVSHNWSFRFLRQIQVQTNAYTSKVHITMYSILRWLAEQRVVEDSLKVIFDCLRRDEITLDKIKTDVTRSLSMYYPSNASGLEKYFTDNVSSCEGIYGTRAVVSPWFIDLIRCGKIHRECLDVVCTQRVFTPIQVENPELPTSNNSSRRLRQILYGILLPDEGDQSAFMEAASRDETYHGKQKSKARVEEYDREGNSSICCKIKPVHIYPVYGKLPAFYDMQSIDKESRKRLLLLALEGQKMDLTEIPQYFHLPLLIVTYWLSHAEPQPDPKCLTALLLCWICGITSRKQDGLSLDVHRLLVWDEAEVLAMIDNFKMMIEPKLKSYGIKLGVAHSFAQLQSIMKYTLQLNDVLLRPYPVVDIPVLYNGTLIHSLYHIVRRQHAWMANFFRGAPIAFALYNSLRTFLDNHILSDALQQVKKQPDGSDCAQAGPVFVNAMSNMFALLDVEDDDY